MHRQRGLTILNALFRHFGALAIAAGISACAFLGGGGEVKLEHAGGVTLTAPAGWKPTNGDDSDAAYRLPSGSIATFTSSCRRDTEASLDVLTRQLLIGTRKWRFLRKEPVEVAGAKAQHSIVDTTMEGKPFQLEIFVFRRADCIFDFTLINPSEISPQDSEAFSKFVMSFHHGKS